jgi:hypothetical protein
MKVMRGRFAKTSGAPEGIWLALGVLGLLGYLSSNPALSVAAVGLLAWFFLLLWRTGEPPILLLAIGFQWVQVTTKVVHADLLGIPVQALSEFGGDIEHAIWLSMGALAALALGMRIALVGLTPAISDTARAQAQMFSVHRLWLLYLASVPASLLVMSMAWAMPGGTQVALALSDLRWVAFFALVYVALVKMQRLHLLAFAIMIELALGIGGFFADFKTVFFVTIIAYVAAGRRLTAIQLSVALGLVSALFMLALVWTAVKFEYRDYLSEGQQAQIVTKGYLERTERLFEMVSELTAEDLQKSTGTMASRLSYVDFFAVATTTVPRRIDHEKGALWGGALQHIFMPRLFFPDKPPLPNDSERTSYYTGLYMAGDVAGTSVSLGYVAESYIDFGRYGMLAPVLLFGILLGSIYRYFLTRRNIPVFAAYGLAVTSLLSAYSFETTSTKLLGAVVTAFLVAFVVQKFAIRRLVRKLIVRRAGAPRAIASRAS